MADREPRQKTRVTCAFRFEAAHHLPHHPGRCRDLHGHGYRLEVTVAGETGADGMVIDFARIEEVVTEEILSHWDHRLLNDVVENPTAEILAHEAFVRLRSAGLDIESVKLWETPDAWVEVGR